MTYVVLSYDDDVTYAGNYYTPRALTVEYIGSLEEAEAYVRDQYSLRFELDDLNHVITPHRGNVSKRYSIHRYKEPTN